MTEPSDKLIEQAFLAGYLVEGASVPVPFEKKQAEARSKRKPKLVVIYTTTPAVPTSFIEQMYANPPTNH